MPDLPVVGDAPSKAAGGAGSFLQKRIGPLPLWAWVGGVAVGSLALRFVKRGGGPAVSGAGVATAPGPSAFTPASASSQPSFSAPFAPPPPTTVNLIVPGYSQPNAVSGAAAGGPPEIVATPIATAPSSHVGSTPSSVYTPPRTSGYAPITLTGPGAFAPVVGGPTPYGGPGSGPYVPSTETPSQVAAADAQVARYRTMHGDEIA